MRNKIRNTWGGKINVLHTTNTHNKTQIQVATEESKQKQKQKSNKSKNKQKKNKQYSNTFVVTQIAVDISPKQCPAHDKHDKTQIQTTARLRRRKHHRCPPKKANTHTKKMCYQVYDKIWTTNLLCLLIVQKNNGSHSRTTVQTTTQAHDRSSHSNDSNFFILKKC